MPRFPQALRIERLLIAQCVDRIEQRGFARRMPVRSLPPLTFDHVTPWLVERKMLVPPFVDEPISKEEWMASKGAQKKFTSLDKDSDGILSKEEYTKASGGGEKSDATDGGEQ